MPKTVVGKLLEHPVYHPDWMRHETPALPPTHDPADDPGRCYHINTDYVRFMVALLSYYCWPDAFTGDEEAKHLAAERFAELQVILMAGNIVCVEDIMYLLRQSPIDPCVLEQSTDNGLTWTTAFDYGLCRGSISPPTMVEITAVLSAVAVATAVLEKQYDDTPESIWPDCGFEQNERDAYREDAMCYALSVLLATLEQTIKAQQDKGIDWRDVARLTAEALGTLAALVLAAKEVGLTSLDPRVEFATWVVLVFSGKVIEWLESVGDEPDLTPLLDSSVQADLLCCAMDKCRGATPSIGVFAGLFDGCEIEGMNPDTQYMLEQLVENAGVYLNFLDFVRAGFDAIDSGQKVACPCDEGWEVDIDCTLPSLPGFLSILNGTHVSGTGINVANRLVGGIQLREAEVKFTPVTAGFTLTNVLMEYVNLDYGGGGSGISTIVFDGSRADPPVYYLAKHWTRAQVTEGAGTKLDDCAVTLANHTTVTLNCSYGSYAGTGTIVRIRLRGDGENPFTS